MTENKIKKSKANIIQRAVIAALLAIIVVCCSNLVVYAATGTGWIGRIIVSWSEEENEVNFQEEKKIEVYDQEENFTAAPAFVTPLPK